MDKMVNLKKTIEKIIDDNKKDFDIVEEAGSYVLTDTYVDKDNLIELISRVVEKVLQQTATPVDVSSPVSDWNTAFLQRLDQAPESIFTDLGYAQKIEECQSLHEAQQLEKLTLAREARRRLQHECNILQSLDNKDLALDALRKELEETKKVLQQAADAMSNQIEHPNWSTLSSGLERAFDDVHYLLTKT